MMNETPSGQIHETWDALHERILKLAHRRSQSLLAGDDEDDAFDRGARALRTLMSAAEAANRMKREEAKERDAHEQEPGGADFTEEDIEAAYRRVSKTVDRIEREDAGAASTDPEPQNGGAAGAERGAGGKALAGERP